MSDQTARSKRDLRESPMRIDLGGLGQASDYSASGQRLIPPGLCDHACVDVIREAACEFLVLGARIAAALEGLASDHASNRTGDRSSGTTDCPRSDAERRCVDSQDTARPDSMNAQSRLDRLAVLEGQQLENRELLAEILQLVRDALVPHDKQWYTVAEVEKCTPYTKWTIRRACAKGRITAQKGRDCQWRVPHEQVIKIQNEGLPPE